MPDAMTSSGNMEVHLAPFCMEDNKWTWHLARSQSRKRRSQGPARIQSHK